MVDGSIVQRMPSREEAQTLIPISQRTELAQQRTSILNMLNEYYTIHEQYSAGFPKTAKEAEGGKAQTYFDRAAKQVTLLVRNIKAMAVQFRGAEDERKKKVLNKRKHQKRGDNINEFLKKIDVTPLAPLQQLHHELYMNVISSKAGLNVLGENDMVGQTTEGPSGGVHTLGKGQMNTPQGVKTGFHKKDIGEVDDAGFGTEITPENAKQGMRGAAVFELNELLGLGVIPYTAMTKFNKQGENGQNGGTQTGQFMEEAKGYSGNVSAPSEEITEANYLRAQQILAQIKDPKTSKEDRKKLKFDMALDFGGDVVAIGGKYYRMTQAALDIDWMQPVLQRDLSTLQLFDMLIAHADRHAANYIIEMDEQGQAKGVKGIDNDSTWGKHVDQKLLTNTGSFGWRKRLKTPGLPPVIDAEVALKVLNTSFEKVREIMTKYDLSQEEIAAAESRWTFVTEHVKGLVRAGKIATMGSDETTTYFTMMSLYFAMGEPMPENFTDTKMMTWGDETKGLQQEDNSYTGHQKAMLEHQKPQGIKGRPWEEN